MTTLALIFQAFGVLLFGCWHPRSERSRVFTFVDHMGRKHGYQVCGVCCKDIALSAKEETAWNIRSEQVEVEELERLILVG